MTSSCPLADSAILYIDLISCLLMFIDFITGLTAFDFISDFEEWIECGYFNEEIKARLKGKHLGCSNV